jgi:adenine-specific DNA-methyltransferase
MASTRYEQTSWHKMAIKRPVAAKIVKSLTHEEAKRRNIPTAEYESVVEPADRSPIRVAYERRNSDLDPQLVWRGKDEQGAADLIVQAPPLFIQEKVHPKALIDDLLRDTRQRAREAGETMPDLFSDFNGLPKGVDKTEFYRHDQNWSNRMILGDSLQVMASLAEREGLGGKVQCIYFDPPYGIKFNSNFQWSTTSSDTKDGNIAQITREPEQVKAFRDTWRDGIHSYLTYLRDRLTLARDLLSETGSIFVQIGDENIHRVRAILDEVFGDDNAIVTIYFRKTTTQSGDFLADTNDYILWYARNKQSAKFRQLNLERRGLDWVNYDFVMSSDLKISKLKSTERDGTVPLAKGTRVYRRSPLTSTSASESTLLPFESGGQIYRPGKGGWKTNSRGLSRLAKSERIETYGSTASFRRYTSDFPFFPLSNSWTDTASGGYGADKIYVVQTNVKVVERCILMTTDPGDLVIDPTCGSGTTAVVAEQWGRRWITMDTSRVALALARARVMGLRYPYYLLADSKDGQAKEAELTGRAPSAGPFYSDVRQGFVHERVPHVTLKSIANNSEIDVIWDRWQAVLEPLRESINSALSKNWHDWEIPRELDAAWSEESRLMHAKWWESRIARHREIDASIATKAEFEYLHDKPYEDKRTARVAGPFTVESLSPHRELGLDENDRPIDPLECVRAEKTFTELILDNLKTAGVQQAHKEDKVAFTALVPWPGDFVCADGRYLEGSDGSEKEKRAGIFIGPEFGTIMRQDLVLAAREASDAGFDVLISCGFNYEAYSTEFNKLGRLPVLKARMNADLHMSSDLAKTAKANLFVVFGEPDITLLDVPNDMVCVKINGVDVYHPNTGEVTSSSADEIACWFIDTDYNEESFFVRHAYFLGANDPYDALKRTLKAEVDAEAWASLHRNISRAFPKPGRGRIAVKVINHLGDEVMKVFKVS